MMIDDEVNYITSGCAVVDHLQVTSMSAMCQSRRDSLKRESFPIPKGSVSYALPPLQVWRSVKVTTSATAKHLE